MVEQETLALNRFEPTAEQILFKEIIHSRLLPHELLTLHLSASTLADKFYPFDVSTVTDWLKDRKVLLWLMVTDEHVLYLQSKKRRYLEQLESIALGEESGTSAQIKALEKLLEYSDRTAAIRNQTIDPSKTISLELKEAPKSLGKLTDFELKNTKKHLVNYVKGDK
jgi:hypothetical protein